MKPPLLVLIPMPRASIEAASAHFELVDGRDAARAPAIAAHGTTLQAVLTNGTTASAPPRSKPARS